jgi:hypothetical protein
LDIFKAHFSKGQARTSALKHGTISAAIIDAVEMRPGAYEFEMDEGAGA